MAPRAHGKGYLKLSLVSCPIALYPAISAAERVSFRQVNRQTGNRLRQQLVDTVTGEVVDSLDKGRGYEVGERQLLQVSDEDLEAAQQKARRWPKVAPPVLRVAQPIAEPVLVRGAPLRRAEPHRELAKTEDVPARADPPAAPVRVENNR